MPYQGAAAWNSRDAMSRRASRGMGMGMDMGMPPQGMGMPGMGMPGMGMGGMGMPPQGVPGMQQGAASWHSRDAMSRAAGRDARASLQQGGMQQQVQGTLSGGGRTINGRPLGAVQRIGAGNFP